MVEGDDLDASADAGGAGDLTAPGDAGLSDRAADDLAAMGHHVGDVAARLGGSVDG